MADEQTGQEQQTETNKGSKMKFDEGQLAYMQTYAATEAAKAAKIVEDKAKADLAAAVEKAKADAKAEFEAELKKTVPPKKDDKAPETPVVGDDKQSAFQKQLEAQQAQINEAMNIVKGLRTERDELQTKLKSQAEQQKASSKQDAFFKAAGDSKLEFFNLTAAYKLAQDDGFEWDEEQNKPTIKNHDTGREKLNGNGEPMSPLDYVKDFAKRNDYLVKSKDQNGGFGNGSQRRTEQERATDDLPDFSTMDDAAFAKYEASVLNKRR